MACKPHYALFSSNHALGGRHDYKNHKDNYKQYVEYLKKTPTELRSMPNDQQNDQWAGLADSAYIGPAEVSNIIL